MDQKGQYFFFGQVSVLTDYLNEVFFAFRVIY